MKKSVMFRIFAVVLLLIFTLSLAACGGEVAPQPKSNDGQQKEAVAPAKDPANAPDKKRTFAIVYPVIHPFFDPVTVSAENYVKEHEGIEILIKAPESGNVQQQVEILENLIAMNVDGVAIGSTDADALAPIIDKAVDKGIPVVTFDSDTPNCKRAGYIGTNNYSAGVQMAHVVAKHLNNKGEVIILQDTPTQLNLVDRLSAIEETIAAEYPDIIIKDVQAGYADPAKSVEVLEAGGPAGIAVWKAKGWTKADKKIITFDNTEENLEGLRDGIIYGLVSQRQHTWGVKIIESLNALCDGKQISEFDDTGTMEITIENIDTYQD